MTQHTQRIFKRAQFSSELAEIGGALAMIKAQGEIKWAIKNMYVTTPDDLAQALACYAVSGLIWGMNELVEPEGRGEAFDMAMMHMNRALDRAARDASSQRIADRISDACEAEAERLGLS